MGEHFEFVPYIGQPNIENYFRFKFIFMQRLRPVELFLMEIIFYTLLWLWNDYIATLLSLVFSSIAFAVLLISLVAEFLEPTKVPRWYFIFMVISIITPLLAAAYFVGIMDMQVTWLK